MKANYGRIAAAITGDFAWKWSGLGFLFSLTTKKKRKKREKGNKKKRHRDRYFLGPRHRSAVIDGVFVGFVSEGRRDGHLH